jgi:protocatechuate 3,4-dioxygenase, beta subunit
VTNSELPFFSRRQFMKGLTFSAAALYTPGVFAEGLTLTPRQTEGPFYPNKLPLDTDNDLIIMNDKLTPAVGTITHLTGRVLGTNGNPVGNAVVEIWQCDNKGIYFHTRAPGAKTFDSNFQAYGRFLTNRKGEFYFRTIKPMPYTDGILRTPHIHVIVKQGTKRLVTTQMYIKGHKLNRQDRILNNIRNKKARDSVLVDFNPLKGSKVGELQAHFDIVVGLTPNEADAKEMPKPKLKKKRRIY